MSSPTMNQGIKGISKYRNTQIEYPCGCRYLFDHRIVLERICSDHENELIAHRG
jgi:hypothetical protein